MLTQVRLHDDGKLFSEIAGADGEYAPQYFVAPNDFIPDNWKKAFSDALGKAYLRAGDEANGKEPKQWPLEFNQRESNEEIYWSFGERNSRVILHLIPNTMAFTYVTGPIDWVINNLLPINDETKIFEWSAVVFPYGNQYSLEIPFDLDKFLPKDLDPFGMASYTWNSAGNIIKLTSWLRSVKGPNIAQLRNWLCHKIPTLSDIDGWQLADMCIRATKECHNYWGDIWPNHESIELPACLNIGKKVRISEIELFDKQQNKNKN